MRCSLVIVTIAAALSSTLVQCLLQLEAIGALYRGLEVKRDGDTSLPVDSISTEDDESTEEPASRQIINERGQSGPGSLCRQQTDCAHDLVCLASGTCGCSNLSPVLIVDAESFACVLPRRLNEPCLSHSECSHDNKHAFCLDAVCRCPSRFRTNEDKSLCLPESVMLNLMTTAILPALLLILAVVCLGVLSYRRLYKSSDDKKRAAEGLLLSLEDTSFRVNVRSRDDPASLSHERLSDCSRQRSLYMNHTFGLGGASSRCKNALSDSNSSCPMIHKEDLTKCTPLSSKYTDTRGQTSDRIFSESYGTSNGLASRTSSPLGSAQHLIQQPSVGGSMTTYAPSLPSRTLESEGPTFKKRTRIPTLSTSTLMPSRRSNRRSNFSSSESSTATTFTYKNRRGFLGSALSSLRETDTEVNSEKFERSSTLPELANFTASELRAAVPKKFRSEHLGATTPKQTRRAVSDLHDPLSAVPEERTDDYPCCCAGCPNVHFYAPSEGSLSPFDWRTESCMKLFADEEFDNDRSKSLLTCSQPTWPCERVVWKSPDRKARTCEAFTVQHVETRPRKQGKRLKMKITAVRRLPRVPLESRTHRPASGDLSHRHRQDLNISMTSNATESDVTRASVPIVRSVAFGTLLPRSSGEQLSRRLNARGRSPVGRTYLSAPHAGRMAAGARRSVDH